MFPELVFSYVYSFSTICVLFSTYLMLQNLSTLWLSFHQILFNWLTDELACMPFIQINPSVAAQYHGCSLFWEEMVSVHKENLLFSGRKRGYCPITMGIISLKGMNYSPRKTFPSLEKLGFIWFSAFVPPLATVWPGKGTYLHSGFVFSSLKWKAFTGYQNDFKRPDMRCPTSPMLLIRNFQKKIP